MPSLLPRLTLRGTPEEMRRIYWLAERNGCSAAQLVLRLVNKAYLAHRSCPDGKADPEQADGPPPGAGRR